MDLEILWNMARQWRCWDWFTLSSDLDSYFLFQDECNSINFLFFSFGLVATLLKFNKYTFSPSLCFKTPNLHNLVSKTFCIENPLKTVPVDLIVAPGPIFPLIH